MTRNRARNICRMRDIQTNIRFTYDLLESVRKKVCYEQVPMLFKKAA